MRNHLWLLPSSAAALVVLAGMAVRAAVPVSEQRQAELVRLVRQDCGSCHGMTLKGGLGKALLPNDLAALDTGTIAQIIEDGLPGTPMPPWKGLLTQDETQWIAAKLKEGFPP